MPSLWFIMPAHGRIDLARICMTQLRRTCDELDRNGVRASAIVIANDENLDTARDLGFGWAMQLTQNSGTNNDTTTLFRLDNGTATSLTAVANFDWAVGDKFGLECIGSAIKAYRNTGSGWTQILSATDSTYNIAGPCGRGVSQTTGRINDFFMGDVVASAVPRYGIVSLGSHGIV